MNSDPPDGYENAPASVRRARLMRIKSAHDRARAEANSPANTAIKIVIFIMLLNVFFIAWMVVKQEFALIHFPFGIIVYGIIFIYLCHRTEHQGDT